MATMDKDAGQSENVWSEVAPGVFLFRDSCNVYALHAPDGMIVVDAGTGYWLAYRDKLPAPVAAVVCTHYFRDHAAGAAAAARAGIPVYVPDGERDIFTHPNQHFAGRKTYITYDNTWDLFAPIEPTPIAGVLRDYDRINIAGATLEVIPLPGVTPTQIGLGVTLTDGRQAIFCGEAIHSPGRIARIAPLQYNYNDLDGAVPCIVSARELQKRNPDILLPGLGEPMVTGTAPAVAALLDNLKQLIAIRPGMHWVLDETESEPLTKVTEHVWWDRHSMANTWYVLSDSGKVLALDYGYHSMTAASWPYYPRPDRRRALLHGLDALKQQFGIDRIDVVLVSHFHDDHVCGIPVLQRVFGTQCWAAENFADLLEFPEAHCFPCNWPVPTKVDRRLPLDQPFTWEEYTFRLHPMNGHTRFAALIGFEADGKRFAHTGDQYFFNAPTLANGFAGLRRSTNWVYRNGALLDGYTISGEWMLAQRPDIVLQGHQEPMFTDDAFFEHIAAWPQDYADRSRKVMPLGDDETHFNLDSWGGWIWPYRTHLAEPATFEVRVTVRNPLPRPAMLDIRLVGPSGWVGESAQVQADARAEVSTMLSITPTGPCYRQPFAVELNVEGRPFGQVAEALATLGHDTF